MSILAWNIIISGFRQDLSRVTGCEKLYLQLLCRPVVCVNADAQPHQPHQVPSVVNLYQSWDDNWAHLAEFIARASDTAPRISVFAYSWGAGWGFIKLAGQLGRRGLKISHAVLCDAVYRSPLLPTWLPANPLSMTRWPKISVPANVGMVTWFFQKIDHPRGHRIVADNPRATTIRPGIELRCGHRWADEQSAWHTACLEEARP